MTLVLTFNVCGKTRVYKFSHAKMEEMGIDSGTLVTKLLSKYPLMEIVSINDSEEFSNQDDPILNYVERY